MLRFARIIIPGAAHHVTRRGKNKADVFFVDDDRRAYLELPHRREALASPVRNRSWLSPVSRRTMLRNAALASSVVVAV
jgi:hypothetical protein